MKEMDEFLVFCERELGKWRGVMQEMQALTDEIQEVGGSTRQELYDSLLIERYVGDEDETDLQDDLD